MTCALSAPNYVTDDRLHRHAITAHPLKNLSTSVSTEGSSALDELVTSVDYFVGCGQQRRWNGEVEGFSGLQIYDQLETRRLFDRQITGLCAF